MRLPGLFLLATLVVAGSSHAGSPASLPAVEPAPQPAPALHLKDAAGQTTRLADFRGRWVLVHFWASWCGACVQELPSLSRLQQAQPALAVLAVNLGDKPAQVQAMRLRLALPLPLWREGDGRAMRTWQVEGLPLSFLIGPDGRIVSRITGSRDWDSPALRSWLQQQLTPAAAPQGKAPS